jgi:flagellar hook-associated protein 3 FlgL
MTQGIDPSAARFLADLSRIQTRAERAQRQISSGRKVNVPSDDPDHLQVLLVTKSHLEEVTQIRTNLDCAKTEADTAEQVLAEAVKAMDQAAQIGVEGANSLKSPQSRDALAVAVQGILERLVAMSGTGAGGRHLFSGDSDQVAPYTVDLAQPNGVSAYAGSAATREMMHPAGTRFALSKAAQEIFDSPEAGKNMFAAVNRLRLALENGPTVPMDDPAYETQLAAQSQAVADGLLQVRSARDHLSTELTYAGEVQNRVDEAIQFAHKLELREQTALSNLQDADLVAAALEVSQTSTHQAAALGFRAMLPRTSLFDFLA